MKNDYPVQRLNLWPSVKLALLFLVVQWCTTPLMAQSVSVNANNTQQYISMMGGDMERSGPNFLNAANQREIIDWCVKDIPVNTWRVRYDKKQEMTEGVKDFSVYEGDLLAMQMMLEANPSIKFFATMKSDYHGYSEGNRNNLPTFIYDYAYNVSDGTTSGTKSFDAEKLGVFLADYLEYMEQSGVPISYLSTSKEWVQVVTADRAKTAIERLIDECSTRGISMPLLIDACTWSITQGVNTVNNYVANGADAYIYGYSAHDYWSSETKTWGDFAAAANTAGKLAIADETGHGGGGKTTTESAMSMVVGNYVRRAGFYEGGIQGEQMFEVWPRGYNEVSTTGFYAKPIFFDNGSAGRRMRSYYIMKAFMTNAVDRHYISSSTSSSTDVYTMAFGNGDEIALWVMNQGTTDYNSMTFNISNFNLKWGMLINQTYWDENTAITGQSHAITASATNTFSANIKANSINCFVITRDYKLTPYYQIDGGAWVANSTDVRVTEGASLKFGPQNSASGTWAWTGPNGYSATGREITRTNMTPAMAGDYVGTFTSQWGGYTSTLTMQVTMNCNSSPATSPYYQINGGAWANSSSVLAQAGDTIRFGPQPNWGGTWQWTGTEDFSASTREVDINGIHTKQVGDFTATYTSNAGCSVDVVYNVDVLCSTTPSITPYSRVNTDSWTTSTSLSISEGDTLQLGPQSSATGTWDWSGPDNYYAQFVRQVNFYGMATSQAGDYVVTRTTPDGCSASVTFSVAIAEKKSAVIGEQTFFRHETGSKVVAYPNPVVSTLTINMNTSGFEQYTVFDMHGRSVLRGKLLGERVEIDVESLKKGIYTVVLQGNNQQETLKVMK